MAGTEFDNVEQSQAFMLAAMQVRNWLKANYSDDLTGKQVRAIAAGVVEIVTPMMKMAVTVQLADQIAVDYPEIGRALHEVAAAFLDEEVASGRVARD